MAAGGPAGGAWPPQQKGPHRSEREGRAAPAGELPLRLCVEHNPINALLTKETINGIGRCRLLLADNGDTAFQPAQTQRPDLLFSGIHMAKMDGLTLVARLRANPDLRTVCCIAVPRLG